MLEAITTKYFKMRNEMTERIERTKSSASRSSQSRFLERESNGENKKAVC
jgi:hypothetical protein